MGDIEKMKRYPFSIHHYSSLCHICHRHVNLQYELDTNLQESQLYLQFYNFIWQASNVIEVLVLVRVNVCDNEYVSTRLWYHPRIYQKLLILQLCIVVIECKDAVLTTPRIYY